MNQAAAFLLILLCALHGRSQTADTVRWKSDAALTGNWPQPAATSAPFRFSGSISLESRGKWVGGTWHVHYATQAQWLKSQSFLSDSLADRYRPLAQLYFDCYELESRRLQETVNVSDIFLAEELSAARQQAQERIAALHAATEDGKNARQLTYWRKWMDSALVATPRLFPPNYEQGDWAFGFDLGAGSFIAGGNLAQYFDPAFGWSYGVGLRVRRFAVDYSMLHTFTRPKLGFSVADFSFGDTNQLRINHGALSVGFQAVRKERWSVIPYAGLSAMRVFNRDVNDGSLFFKSRISLNAEAGIMAEWRSHTFLQNNRAQFSWKLLLRAGYAPVNFLGAVSGNAVKLQAGIGWTLRTVRNTRLEQ